MQVLHAQLLAAYRISARAAIHAAALSTTIAREAAMAVDKLERSKKLQKRLKKKERAKETKGKEERQKQMYLLVEQEWQQAVEVRRKPSLSA
jgi:hypothetical protein